MKISVAYFTYRNDAVIHWNDYETGFQLANIAMYDKLTALNIACAFIYHHKERKITVQLSGVVIPQDLQDWVKAAVDHYTST